MERSVLRVLLIFDPECALLLPGYGLQKSTAYF